MNEVETKSIEPEIMGFGKHRGKTLAAIASEDPGYIVWLHEAGVKAIPPDLFRKCRQEVDLDAAASEAIFESMHGDCGCRQ